MNFANGRDLSQFPTRFDGQAVDPSRTFIQTQTISAPGARDAVPAYVRLSDFYASLPVGGGAGSGDASSAALAVIAARLDRASDRFREGIALAGAINVLPPEPGRKINISVGGAGYDGAAAASIAVAARINESTVGYVGVARGPTQTLVKGGFGWSPW